MAAKAFLIAVFTSEDVLVDRMKTNWLITDPLEQMNGELFVFAHKQPEQIATSPECFWGINKVIHCYLQKSRKLTRIIWWKKRWWCVNVSPFPPGLSVSTWSLSKTVRKQSENISVLKERPIIKPCEKENHTSFLVYCRWP